MIILDLLISFTSFQYAFSLAGTVNPFSDSNAKIESILSQTSNGKYVVNLQYSPELVGKGELTFFMANLFNNIEGKQIRMRHVDCDFIIEKDKIELFRLSTKYGEPLIYAINGVMLASFAFNETGNYTISIELAGQYSIPIRPVFANFSAMVTHTSDRNLEVKLST